MEGGAMERRGPAGDWVKVHATPRQDEIAFIKSLLDAEGIPYFIKGEHFGTLYGPVHFLSSMEVMVTQDRLEDARELLKDFIEPQA